MFILLDALSHPWSWSGGLCQKQNPCEMTVVMLPTLVISHVEVWRLSHSDLSVTLTLRNSNKFLKIFLFEIHLYKGNKFYVLYINSFRSIRVLPTLPYLVCITSPFVTFPLVFIMTYFEFTFYSQT